MEGSSSTFAVGALVRIKKGVVVPKHPKIRIGGWLGTVSQVSGRVRLVQWHPAFREAVRPIYHNCLEQSGDGWLQAMWLPESALEGDPGEPLAIERCEQADTRHG
jgi:hypothetical protein